jgi:fumarate reductase (CoM/CoB) subunit A
MPIQPSTFVAGGKLFNSRGERFMEAYDPVKKEAAMRDISARGIFDQIRRGLDVEGGVVLDVSGIPDEQFRIDNTKVIEALDPKGIDYRQIPLIIAPEAHFFMGGVVVDGCGRTPLRGLYAAGENAGGLHGGNRLNSNAVPETQVFGHRAGIDAAERAGHDAARAQAAVVSAAPAAAWRERLAAIADANAQAGEAMDALVERVQSAVNLGIGIVRTAEGLSRCIGALAGVAGDLESTPTKTLGDVVAAGEIADMCRVGTVCAESALMRTESRAAHYREDFPRTDPAWVQTIVHEGGRMKLVPVARDVDEFSARLPDGPADPNASRPGAREFVE